MPEMKQKNLIVSDPSVMMGKPLIAGTRITVEMLLEKMSAGESVEQIPEAHPRLTREAVTIPANGERRCFYAYHDSFSG